MKKRFVLLIAALLWGSAVYGQNVTKSPTLTIAGAAATSTTDTLSAPVAEATVYIRWGTITGSYTTCTVQAQTSFDNVHFLTIGAAVSVTVASNTDQSWTVRSGTAATASATVAQRFGPYANYVFTCGAYGTSAVNTIYVDYHPVLGAGGGGGGTLLTASTTYYVAPSGTTTCTYNGDTGTTCAPSDTGGCLSKASPCATLAGVATIVNGFILGPGVVLTVQLANATASSTGDCYKPSNVIFYVNSNQSWSNTVAYYNAALVNGGLGLTDTMPASRLDIIGDTTTPTNVILSGVSGNCNTTTPSTTQGITMAGGVSRTAGMRFNYFKGLGWNASGASLALFENGGGTNDSTATNSYALSCIWSNCRFGGTISVTNYFIGINVDGGRGDDSTATAVLTYTYSGNTAAGIAIECQEGCHWYWSRGLLTSSGAGAYVFFNAQDHAYISNNDGGITSFAYNGNTGVIPFRAQVDSIILGVTMANSGSGNFTFSQTAGQPTVTGRSESNSKIFLGGTSGKGVLCGDNQWVKGGMVFANWFNQGPVCGEYVALSNMGGAVYTALTGNTIQYLGSGNDSQLAAGRFNSSGRHLQARWNGIWSTNNNTDTLTVALQFCQVANCASGTIVTIGTFPAFADGAAGAITDQAWWVQLDCDLLTTGSSATASCEAVGTFYQTTSLIAANIAIANNAATTFNATVAEFVEISATFSAASANDKMQARTMTIREPN